MFKLLKNVFGYIGGKGSDFDDEIRDEDCFQLPEDIPDGEADEFEEIGNHQQFVFDSRSITTQHRNGKITKLGPDDGVIDERYFFDRRKAPSSGLDLGKTVTYRAYRRNETSEWKVDVVIAVHEEMWDVDDSVTEDTALASLHLQDELPQQEHEILDCGISKRWSVTAKVMSRDGREVVVRDYFQPIVSGGSRRRDTRFSLDNIISELTPIEGDIVRMEAIFEISAEYVDALGDVLEVISIKPARQRSDCGVVTNFSRQGSGVVDENIYFERSVCAAGYVPHKNDEVRYEVMEFDRKGFTWRALLIEPVKIYQSEDKPERAPKLFFKCMDRELQQDKGQIVVQETKFGRFPSRAVPGENYELQVGVTNTGTTEKMVFNHYIETKPSNLELIHPTKKGVKLKPRETFFFVFKFNRQFLGSFREAFILDFKDFRIGREIEWEVVPSDQYTVLPEPTTPQTDRFYAQNRHRRCEQLIQRNESSQFRVPGVRPQKGSSFVRKRFLPYNIPDAILFAMTVGAEGAFLSRKDAKNALRNCSPELGEKLSAENHNQRFHNLLYIAEVDARIDLCRYSMDRANFIRRGSSSEYLALEIDGLAEGRPSLLVGDAIVVTQSWVDRNASKFTGIVHRVCKNEAWFKFDPSFHHSYSGEDYKVHFELSRGSFKKCHHALDVCARTQADLWLFPKCVRSKPPQIILEEDTVCILPSPQSKDSISVQNLFESFKANPKKSEIPENQRIMDVNEIETGVAVTPPASYENVASAEKKAVFGHLRKKVTWFNQRLNSRQKDAVYNIAMGEARPLAYVIFGPPGTGKTVTLVEAILQIYMHKPDSRILVATPSNSSANLIAERLLDSGFLQPDDMKRLVAQYLALDGKIPERLLQHSACIDISSSPQDQEDDSNIKRESNQMIMRRRILIGTCVTLGQIMNLGLPHGHFTNVFIDEAGQATEPEILIPLSFVAQESGQAVLAGDPHQLGPVVPSELASSLGLSVSFLTRLLMRFPYERDAQGFPESGGYDPRLVTRLTINYRSLPDILELPSSLFYNSDLEAWVSEEDSYESQVLKRVVETLKVPHSAVVFHGIKGTTMRDDDSPSFYNPQEFIQITGYVIRLIEAGIEAKDIGVITPYQKQVLKIRQHLEKVNVEVPKVGSVEEFQGQERLVIILSTVRSKGKEAMQSSRGHSIRQLLGFLNNKERLNVAISRARAFLLIVGDPDVLCVDPHWRSVVKYCVDRKAFIGSAIPEQLLAED